MRLEYAAFQTQMYAVHDELKRQKNVFTPLDAAAVAEVLADEQTALLEFVVTEKKTYLFVLTKQTAAALNKDASQMLVQTIDIDRKSLVSLCREFREQLALRRLNFRAAAQRLYQLLIEPAAGSLKGKTKLVIVPDGELWELPFQALQTAQEKYLIENFEISYAQSLTLLREMRKPAQKAQVSKPQLTMLALANPLLTETSPDGESERLLEGAMLSLPETQKQVEALLQIYGRAQSRVYVGAAARENRFKAEAGDARIIHLATHGILADSSPLYSYIALSQEEASKSEDGILEAWEVMEMKLNADLVVLSACETGRGRSSAGEGLIGLTWAFFVAGAPTTIVSQWKVEERSTTELMAEFHRHYQRKLKAPKSSYSTAEALRRASLKLLRSGKHAHPFYWAGFREVFYLPQLGYNG
jgi:CHAT domain-containing protein